MFSFRLHVAGDAQNSLRALADGIVMTPISIRLEPIPARRVIGTLEPTDGVAVALGLGNGLG